ncbi:MAG TPA: YebC/PmpR family DNA-binding transcriptional regulator [Armatimonadota bacterium]|nr:YebC/PmpR family DNA-binding transcriptional regulator [Armatimonadota bacterium]HOS42395.1 YebC/PmpR family DNA-binding transcriptional regulator [Armatimonadota bacterium]
MSGHSKWVNIRIKKGKMDALRGKTFTRLAKEIIAAARAGGGDPNNNLRLRNAIQKAREASMPADNIKRSILRGTGELEGVQYEDVTYEGYGPGGVAVLVQCMTDNRNRTAPEVRSIFRAHGGNMGENGCVSYLFDQKGVIAVGKGAADEDTMLMAALDAGAEDVKTEDEEVYEILTAPADVYTVKEALEAAGIAVQEADTRMVPQTTVTVTGKDAQQVMKLLEDLEENDDVQAVFANVAFSEEALESLA